MWNASFVTDNKQTYHFEALKAKVMPFLGSGGADTFTDEEVIDPEMSALDAQMAAAGIDL